MAAYYNEHEPKAAAWLRELIREKHLPDGEVDERSIEDVCPTELAGFDQCHFFAGIGGWPLALTRAGWPDNRPVWTGSCPCQPFSSAGKGLGTADERHLWPAWHHLIAQCHPQTIFGEQAGAAVRHGWLDLVHTDLEVAGYAVAPVVFPACGIGAPHIRERLYFVAHANDAKRWTEEPRWDERNGSPTGWQQGYRDTWQRLHGEDWQAVAASVCSDVDGDPTRLALLRGLGNAINVTQAQIFIEEAMRCIDA